MAKHTYDVLVSRMQVIHEHTRLHISADDEASARSQVKQVLEDEANGIDGEYEYCYRWVGRHHSSAPEYAMRVVCIE